MSLGIFPAVGLLIWAWVEAGLERNSHVLEKTMVGRGGRLAFTQWTMPHSCPVIPGHGRNPVSFQGGVVTVLKKSRMSRSLFCELGEAH